MHALTREEPSSALARRVAVLIAAGNPVLVAIARRLSAEGACVALLSARPGDLAPLAREAARDGRSVTVLEVDVRDVDAVDRAAGEVVDRLGPPRLIVNNMAMMGTMAGMTGPVAAWRELIDANLIGHLNVMSAFHPVLVADTDPGPTDIVNLVAAESADAPERSIFDAVTAAALTLSDRMRRQLGRSGVRVTELVLDTAEGVVPDVSGRVELLPALPKPLREEDIADFVAYVASLPPHLALRSMTVGTAATY